MCYNRIVEYSSEKMIKVNLFEVTYGGWENLTVAFPVDEGALDTNLLFVTYPTVETILNYEPNTVRKKIASKSLKTFLGGGFSVGKHSATIENKLELKGATKKVSLITLEDFLSLATWEAVVNQNIEVGQVLASGFSDSFRSIVCEQIGAKLDVDERNRYLRVRNEHRKNFHPKYTYWLKEDADGDSTRVNWAKEVTRLKSACKLPFTSIDTWGEDLIDRLNEAEVEYNILRTIGLTHQQAVNSLKTKRTH